MNVHVHMYTRTSEDEHVLVLRVAPHEAHGHGPEVDRIEIDLDGRDMFDVAMLTAMAVATLCRRHGAVEVCE